MTGGRGHVPVLLGPAVDGLNVRPDGIYVDATLGKGGYTQTIEERLVNGRLVAVDRDPAAVAEMRERFGTSGKLTIVNDNFGNLDAILDSVGIEKIDGIVFDLGVNMTQLDNADRGMSFREDGPLDMRYDRTEPVATAADIVNGWEEKELADLFFRFGERKARKIARWIASDRDADPIESTGRLAGIVSRAKGGRRGDKIHPATKVFLSLRAAVNRELDALETALEASIRRTAPGGRIVVVSYHSLEDGMVKDKFRRAEKGCRCELPPDECLCDGAPMARRITKKPVNPTEEEKLSNKSARSGKLRILERI